MARQGPQFLYDSGFSAVADIVFVHGLRGDAIDTWTKTGVCWPRDLLPKDLPYTRVITWGYDTSIANAKSFTSQNSIFGHAQNLLSDLARTRREMDLTNRPLVFVAHSLGGLVVKEALIRSAEYLYNGQDEDLGGIYRSTRGIVFLGTPHRGSGKANLGHLVSGIAKFTLRQPNPHLLRTLEQGSDVLEHQRNSFSSICSKVPLVCIYEEEPTSGGMIVPQVSAVMDGFNVSISSIPADHMAMCKYDDAGDIGYARTADYIRKIVLKAQEAKREKDRLIQKSEDRILNILRFPEIIQRFEDILEAHKETFQWLFEDLSHGFVDWLRCGEGIFWISGKAGSGKSTLMKYIVDHKSTSEYLGEYAQNSNLCVAAFFFHDRGTQMQKSTHGLLRTILLHILREHRSLIKLAFPEQWAILVANTNCGSIELSPTTEVLVAALKRLAQSACHEITICLFIDGIDEYDGNDEEIIEILKSILSSFRGSSARIKACISSRPYRSFEHAFRNFEHLKVQNLTRSDITRFTVDTLRSYDDEDFMDRDNETTSSLISQVVDKASGVFLWVHLVTHSLGEGLRDGDTLEELQVKLAELPPTLEGLYTRMLQKIKPAHRAQAAKLFQIMLGALQPFDLLTFSFADGGFEEAMRSQVRPISVQESVLICRNMSKRVKSRCVGLLEVFPNKRPDPEPIRSSIDTVNFLHQTVKEFLTSDQNLIAAGLHTETDFDANIALIAAEVRKVKGLRDINSVTRLNVVVNCVSYSHGTRSHAYQRQVELLDEMDRVMTLHQSNTPLLGQSDRHWSGYYATNFHFIGEQPPPASLNFTSFAVMHDLHAYIAEKKRQGSLRVTGKPLISYAIPNDLSLEFEHGEYRMPRCLPSTKLLQVLLEDYPDVNLPLDTESPWQVSLRAYYDTSQSRLLKLSGRRRGQWRVALLEILLVFAKHDADPNALVEIRSDLPKDSRTKSSEKGETLAVPGVLRSNGLHKPNKRSSIPPRHSDGTQFPPIFSPNEVEEGKSLFLTPLDILTSCSDSRGERQKRELISILESKGGKICNVVDLDVNVEASIRESEYEEEDGRRELDPLTPPVEDYTESVGSGTPGSRAEAEDDLEISDQRRELPRKKPRRY